MDCFPYLHFYFIPFCKILTRVCLHNEREIETIYILVLKENEVIHDLGKFMDCLL